MLSCSGDVVTTECFEKLIKKDMLHPLTGQKLKEKDIIPLQRVIKNCHTNHPPKIIPDLTNFTILQHFQGGTGFASVNDKLEATEARPNMMA